MHPSSGLWGVFGLWFPVYYPESTMVRRAPALTLCEHVLLTTTPYTCALCPMFSLCGWPRTSLHLLEEGQNHLIVRFAYLRHMIGNEYVLVSFLCIMLFELGVEVTFYN